MEIAEVYAEGRERICALITGLGEGDAGRVVPTCPGWTVRDVVAHVTGVCADVLSGNLNGVATEAWTDAQVRARRGRTIGEVVEEWTEVGPQVEAVANSFPGRAGEQWIADLTAHEHDIRTAVARPGARDSAGVAIGLGYAVTEGLNASITERRLPPLEVRAGSDEWLVGAGEPSGMVQTSAFELFRALTGRRSATQIRAFHWTVAADPYVAAFQFGPFTTSTSDIEE
ncbi:MAG TPA: maleylpyruvate isomerase family mycothiol-dependent enzyme [Acidimicrobiales bacterium]|nr:maleylpyruvate isomerase family mycothiol-dependent enzyme [Acidimicrobiales bacterium]